MRTSLTLFAALILEACRTDVENKIETATIDSADADTAVDSDTDTDTDSGIDTADTDTAIDTADTDTAVDTADTDTAIDTGDTETGDTGGLPPSEYLSLLTTDAITTIHGTIAGDLVGSGFTTTGNIFGDGLQSALVGATGANGGNGAVYLFSADSLTSDGTGADTGDTADARDAESSISALDASEATTTILGDSGNCIGQVLASLGDVSGSGFGAMAISDYRYNGYEGAVYVFAGPLDAGNYSVSAASYVLTGEAVSGFGLSVADLGADSDGNGKADVVVGSPGTDGVYVYTDVSDPSTPWIATGNYGTQAGNAISTGDFNGDGFQDLLIGAHNEYSGGSNAGGVWLSTAGDYTPGSSVDLSEGAVLLTGETASDFAGEAVAFIGDTNGDGYEDALVGAPWSDGGGTESGVVYLVLGSASLPVSGETLFDTSTAQFIGPNAGAYAGLSLGGNGDVDGDGMADIIIGVTGADTTVNNAGTAYVVLSSSGAVGAISLNTAAFDKTTGTYIEGLVEDGGTGTQVFLADIDGDGQSSAGVSEPGNYSGAAYLFDSILQAIE